MKFAHQCWTEESTGAKQTFHELEWANIDGQISLYDFLGARELQVWFLITSLFTGKWDLVGRVPSHWQFPRSTRDFFGARAPPGAIASNLIIWWKSNNLKGAAQRQTTPYLMKAMPGKGGKKSRLISQTVLEMCWFCPSPWIKFVIRFTLVNQRRQITFYGI